MSRAFVKEPDGDLPTDDSPDRPQSPHTNYVTPQGLQQLREKVRELTDARDALAGREDLAGKQQHRQLDRDLSFYAERVQRAVLVEPNTQSNDIVRFGDSVEVEDVEGERQRFVIVGEDEADVIQGKISWISPLAKALLNARIGDSVTWKRPAGDKELEIVAIGGD